MLLADIGLVQSAMTALNAPPDLIEQIVDLLKTNSEDLGAHAVTKPQQSWFGGSVNGHRIAVNTTMAHQAVEEEFQKLADSLRTYESAIKTWEEDVRDVDAISQAYVLQREQALEQVHAQVTQAQQDATSSNIGDGQYTAPTGEGDA